MFSKTAGKYRTTNVGIIEGSKVGHVAPESKFVPTFKSKMFDFLNRDSDNHFG